MTTPRRDDDENLRAMRQLRAQAPPRAPAAPTPKAAPPSPPARPPTDPGDPFPVVPPPTTAPKQVTQSPPSYARHPPEFRCLACGYPLLDDGELRCSECGHEHDRPTLKAWFNGDEESRFTRVIWLIVATLFLRLFMLPPLLWAARVAAACAIVAAALTAYAGKQGSIGGYYAGATMAAGSFMVLLSWATSPLSYYTLDLIAGCTLLLSLLHEPCVGRVLRRRTDATVPLVVLFLTPLLAGGCYLLLQTNLATTVGTLTLPPAYSPFGFIVPAVAAAAVWLYAWRTAVNVRNTLFRVPDASADER